MAKKKKKGIETKKRFKGVTDKKAIELVLKKKKYKNLTPFLTSLIYSSWKASYNVDENEELSYMSSYADTIFEKEIEKGNNIDKFISMKKKDKYSSPRFSLTKEGHNLCSAIRKQKEALIDNATHHSLDFKDKKEEEAKTTKSKSDKSTYTKVNSVDLQVSIIKSFYLMLNKKVEVKRILTLYRKIEKSALEKTIRKTGKYAVLIEEISTALAKEYNSGKSKVIITTSEKVKGILKEIAYSEKQRKTVSLLKRKANIVGKEDKEKAQKLLKAINKAKTPKNDPYYNKIQSAKKTLENYIDKDSDIEMSKSELRGLGSTELISSAQLDEIDFDIYNFSGKWAKVVGKPSNPFMMMVHGQAKGGKSSFALQFTRYLSKNINQKVAYYSAEEGLNHTFVDKLKRFDAINDNLYISKNLPENLTGIDFLFIDSINYADIKIEQLQAIKDTNPELSIVYIMHETKGGTYKGGSEWEHFADIIVGVYAGTAKTERSRYNQYGEMKVF